MGCKKKLDTLPENSNYDAVNNIFRVVVSSDASYSVVITQQQPNSSVPDVISTQSSNTLPYNYGFTASSGAKINVKVVTTSGNILNCEILYKYTKIGGDTKTANSNGGYSLNFDYTVPN